MDLIDLIHCKQGQSEKLDKFAPRYVKIWRLMEQNMDEKFFSKVFLDNINHILRDYDIDYVRGPFIYVVNMLIEKERYMLKSSQLK